MKKSQLLNLYHFNGILNRKEYLIVYISLFVLSQSISSLGSFLNQQLVIFVLLGVIYFSLTAGVKRMRDAGKPWWVLFVPIYGLIVSLTHPTKLVNSNVTDSPSNNKMAKILILFLAFIMFVGVLFYRKYSDTINLVFNLMNRGYQTTDHTSENLQYALNPSAHKKLNLAMEQNQIHEIVNESNSHLSLLDTPLSKKYAEEMKSYSIEELNSKLDKLEAKKQSLIEITYRPEANSKIQRTIEKEVDLIEEQIKAIVYLQTEAALNH